MKKILKIILLISVTLSPVNAQVYSENIVGYALKRFDDGFAMVSNPLNHDSNTVKKIFGASPPPITIYKYNGTFWVNSYDPDFKEWDYPNQTLLPGEGFFVHMPSGNAGTMMFIGEAPREGELKISLNKGFSMVGSKVPQVGLLSTDLKFPIGESAIIYQYKNGKYSISDYDSDFDEWNWEGVNEEPQIGLAEAFWVFRDEPGEWYRNFKWSDFKYSPNHTGSSRPIIPTGPSGRNGEGRIGIVTNKDHWGNMIFRIEAVGLLFDVPYYLEFTNTMVPWTTIQMDKKEYYLINNSPDPTTKTVSTYFRVRQAVNPALFRLRKDIDG